MSSGGSNSSVKSISSGEFYPSHKQIWKLEEGTSKWQSEVFYNVHSITKWHIELAQISDNFELALCHHASKDETVIASFSFNLETIQKHPEEMGGSTKKTVVFNGNKQIIVKPIKFTLREFSSILCINILEKVMKIVKKSHPQSLVSEISRMWDAKELCDFVISVKGIDIEAHSSILAGASPVFAAMTKHHMLERSTNRLEINDFDELIIRELLKFVYTRVDPAFTSFELLYCLNLLSAADKYGLDMLIPIISRYLVFILSIENVAEILLTADRHSVPDLKEESLKFLCTRGLSLPEVKFFDVLSGESELWKEIALRKLERQVESSVPARRS